MSEFFWNVRGLNKSAKHSIVRNWVHSKGFQFGGLLETRVSEGKSGKIASSIFKDWSLIRITNSVDWGIFGWSGVLEYNLLFYLKADR